MRSISNPQRGCGTLVKGGYYAQSSFGQFGLLQSAWCFGSCADGGHGVVITGHPKRAQQVIYLAETLMNGGNWQSGLVTGNWLPSLYNLPEMAILDHVGSNNYTPWSFAQEVFTYGVSRRITPDLARRIGKDFGANIPILFTHSQMPFMADYDPSIHYPTFADEKWGIYLGDKNGSDHPMIPIIRKWDGTVLEQPFLLSWITNVVYIHDENNPELSEMMTEYVEVVTIDEG
jgi:hypothetical protein